MAKEVFAASVKSVVGERTNAFGRNRRNGLPARANAILNIDSRAASLRNKYGNSNSERINSAARRMYERLTKTR